MTRVAMISSDGAVMNHIAAPDFPDADSFGRWVLALNMPHVSFRALDDETEASVAIGWKLVDGVFVEPPTPLAVRLAQINEATAERIASGFTFQGQRISLSEPSQLTISNAFIIRESLPYPLRWANADDTGFVTLESAKDMEALYAAATMAVLLARTEGNARKAAAMAEVKH